MAKRWTGCPIGWLRIAEWSSVGVTDLDGDKLPDLVLGGMKGAHVVLHKRANVTEEEWKKAQPVRFEAPDPTPALSGKVFEAEQMTIASITGGTAAPQPMGGFSAGKWSDDSQLWWSGGKPGDRVELEFSLQSEGNFDLKIALTKAVRLWDRSARSRFEEARRTDRPLQPTGGDCDWGFSILANML